MAPSFRRALVPLSIASLAILVLTACASPSETKAVATSGQTIDIVVENTGSAVRVENRAGRPLTDVRVTIQPIGNKPPFSESLRQLDTAERRTIALAQFKNSEGTALNPMFVLPKQVTVTAKDALGNPHEVTVRWKQ